MDDIKNKFLDRLASAEQEFSQDIETDSLKSLITKELSVSDLQNKLDNCQQDKITVKEIVVESAIDFLQSVKQLKNVFQFELEQALTKVNDLYNQELLKLQSLYRNAVIGKPLMDLVKKLSENEYSLVMMNNRAYVYKYYDPPLEISEGRYSSGTIHEYLEPVCKLKSIYVNLLHPKITSGTVLINTDRRHPNASDSGLSEACVGSMDGREILINNPEALITLLDEICAMYEVMFLDSAYFIPEAEFEERREKLKWTA
ncbi:MAG: hypothetical protein JST15_05735 [Bacteroidetes bacterium]|nr:hypothetical protein [Bacteroidota bacterium]